MANPARAYLTTQIETTTQGELLLMLYEAAIKFLKRAKLEIDNKDYAKKGIYISKAMAIIHELAESLNKEKGGDITPKLASLYHFCTSHLIKANIRMDKKMIDDVIKILDGISSAYAQIVPMVDGKVDPNQPNGVAQAPVQQPQASPQYGHNAIPPQQVQPVTPLSPTAQPTMSPPVAAQQAQDAPPQPKPKAPLQMPTRLNTAQFRAANAYNNNK